MRDQPMEIPSITTVLCFAQFPGQDFFFGAQRAVRQRNTYRSSESAAQEISRFTLRYPPAKKRAQ